MSTHVTDDCRKCGGKLQSNGGFDSHADHAALHGGMHGIQHGHPIFLLLSAGIAVGRALFPKRYTCQVCGHTVRD